MAVKLTLTGSGSIGEIQPGWSVQEDATPVAPGDSTGSVGQVQLDAAPGIDSEFIVDNKSSFVHDRLGKISGDISGIDAKGATVATNSTVSITSTTPLTKLAVQRTAAGISAGSYYEIMGYTVSSQSPGYYFPGDDTITYSPQATFSIPSITDRVTGNLIGSLGTASSDIPLFVVRDPAGNFYVAFASNVIKKYDTSYALVTTWGATGTGNGQFTGINGMATDGTFIYTIDNSSASRVQKFSLTGTYQTKWGATGIAAGQFFNAGGIAAGPDGNIYVNDAYDYGSAPITMLGNRIQVFSNTGGFLSQWFTGVPYQTSGPIAIDANGVLWMSSFYSSLSAYTLDGNKLYTAPGAVIPGSGSVTGWGWPIANPTSTRAFISNSPTGAGAPYQFVALTSNKMLLSDILHYYINLLVDSTISVSYTVSTNPVITLPGWSGDVWDHLKQICAAYILEIASVNDVVTIRNVGTRTLALDNVQGGSVSLGVDTQATGQSVNINYQNATSGFGTLYDASLDNSKIFTTDVGQFNVETATTNNYIGFINQPIRVDAITADGQYIIYDSSDVPVLVTTTLWNQYGGSVNVSTNPNSPTSLDIAIQGPGALIPGTLAPYKFGYNYGGQASSPAFSITGSAVFTNPIKLTLLTGASRSKNTALSAADVDNFAINTPSQAYDRGIWASSDAGGPVPTLTAIVPTSALAGFGLTAGSLVSFKESIYRITSANISNAMTRISAKRHITTADFNAIATGKTTAQFVTRWGANQTGDFTLKPLRTF